MAPKTPEKCFFPWHNVGLFKVYFNRDSHATAGELLTDSQRRWLDAPASDERAMVRHYTLTADLVLLNADPAQDPTAFARVRDTIRAGRVIWGTDR